MYFGRFFKERSTLKWVQEQVVILEPQVKVATEMRNRLKSLKERTETLANIENQGPAILNILKELTLKTPEYAWLKEIRVVENKVNIVGYSHSKEGETSELIRLFSDSVLFEKPSFDGAIQKIGREDTVTFKMTMELRKPLQQQNSALSSTRGGK
jgi:Tfp pilus assembly protein PilN